MGRIVVFDVSPSGCTVTIDRDAFERAQLQAFPNGDFYRPEGSCWVTLPPERLIEVWDEVDPSHRRMVEAAARRVRRSTWARAHSPAAVETIGSLLGRDLPQPVTSRTWKSFVYWAGKYFDQAEFDAGERDYKLTLAAVFKEAREAAESGAPDWLGKLRAAFTNKHNNITSWRAHDTYLRWAADNPEAARQGLMRIWREDAGVEDRIRGFLAELPQEAIAGPSSRLTVASMLLAAEDPTRWPPYRVSAFDAALELIGDKPRPKRDEATTYSEALEFLDEFVRRARAVGVQLRDRLDAQGVVWCMYGWDAEESWPAEVRRHFEVFRGSGDVGKAVDLSRVGELVGLLDEFSQSYPESEEGRRHLQLYETCRQQARENFERIREAAQRGEDVTDLVLTRLLPHTDSEAHREAGAWIHWAPAINGDIRSWFESAGWVKANDWPEVANAIMGFVERCVAQPRDLAAACVELEKHAKVKGFQSGMLSPILNALRPDDFLLINQKPVVVLSHFSGRHVKTRLREYPKVNALAMSFVDELGENWEPPAGLEIRPADLFDMFTHWLVAVKKYDLSKVRYWKIAPGEQAWQWEECRDNGFIAIGYDELGDLSGVGRREFDRRRDDQLEQQGWWKHSVNQAWIFAKNINVGDYVVANRGKKEVVGIGRVSGPYYFVPGARQGHRLPVEWESTDAHDVDFPAWQSTLLPLERSDF
ncbi:MAG TPA: hypothetical protein VNB06_12255, partial [Thermoanaerobaculia bacterium]|nr:hypothetical protein [Thermoanaerobaculia bacterium]